MKAIDSSRLIRAQRMMDKATKIGNFGSAGLWCGVGFTLAGYFLPNLLVQLTGAALTFLGVPISVYSVYLYRQVDKILKDKA